MCSGYLCSAQVNEELQSLMSVPKPASVTLWANDEAQIKANSGNDAL